MWQKPWRELHLQGGDLLVCGKCNYFPDQNGGRPDLGYVGNFIRDRAGSEFSKDLFENYWQSGGNVNLGNQRFNSIVNAAGAVVSTSSVTLSNGQPGIAQGSQFL